jgi:hypothetical protein
MTGITNFFKRKGINYLHDATTDQLRQALHQQTEELRAAALDNTQGVSTVQIEALERIRRLIEIAEFAQLPRKRWPVVTALGSTLLITSVLLFARVGTTEIDLDLKVSELSFTLAEPWMLTGVVRLSELGFAGLERIRVPRSRNNPGLMINGPDVRGSIYLSRNFQPNQSGSVTLAPLALPTGTQIRIQLADGVNQYQVSLKGTGLKIRVAVEGSVNISLGRGPSKAMVFESPRSVLMQPGSEETNLNFSLSSTSPREIFPFQLPVVNLILARVEQLANSENTYFRQVSTIASGSLYFEELNNKQQSLRSGETLRFESSHGVIRLLEFQDDHFVLRYHGLVQGMTTGSSHNQRSLMPTYLEWLKAQQGLVLLWGTCVYVFLLLLSALRWWGLKI